MKKLLLSIFALVGVASMNAQTEVTESVVLKGDGWASSVVVASGELTFGSEWAEAYVGSDGVFPLSDYKGLELVVSEVPENVQLKYYVPSEESWKDGGYPTITSTTTTLNFADMELLEGVESVKFTIQGKAASAVIDIVSLYMIKTDGTKENVGFSNNWGCTLPICYSGLVGYSKQYGSVGSVENVDLSMYSGYRVVLNSAAPEGVNCKITAKFQVDGETKYSYMESGEDIIDGKKEAYLDFTNCGIPEDIDVLSSISLQAGGENVYPFTLDIKSIELIKVATEDTPNAIEEVAPVADVVKVTYTSLTGAVSSEPVKGVNIKTVFYSDGSKEVSKIVVR